MVQITQVNGDGKISAVQALIREYTAWALTLQDGSEQAPTFKNLEKELADLPGIFSPPSGRLLLAMHDGRPADCIAFKPRDLSTCELTRLYVRPAFRGQGIGRDLVGTLLADAHQAGYERIVLDSHISMKKAHGLYRSFGFQTV